METYAQRVNREDDEKSNITKILQTYNSTHPHNPYSVSYSDGVKFCGGSTHWFERSSEALVFALLYFRG